MTINSSITYLRAGRHVRGSGIVLGTFPAGAFKVKPTREDWGIIIVTAAEFEAGKEKPPLVPRKKSDGEEPAPKRAKKLKAPKLHRWQQLVAEVRLLQLIHEPHHQAFLKMSFLGELADQLEAAQTMFTPNDHGPRKD